jgi:CDP-glucose 4,6-dehydratase
MKTASGQRDYCVVQYKNSSRFLQEAKSLVLETAKASAVLGVHPRWSLAESVQKTLHWYRAQHAGASARGLCESDMTEFENKQVSTS